MVSRLFCSDPNRDAEQTTTLSANGEGNVSLDEFPMEFQNDGSNNPDRNIREIEAESEEREMIEYLERKHKYYGEIFRERFEGNFNRSSIAKKLGIPKSNVIRWYDEITDLAMKKYKEMNSL